MRAASIDVPLLSQESECPFLETYGSALIVIAQPIGANRRVGDLQRVQTPQPQDKGVVHFIRDGRSIF